MSSEQGTGFTILAVDFGTAHTRATLFDVVEDVYRFVGHGIAPTTVAPPYNEASEGLRHAILDLQAATGRALIDEAAQLILPSNNVGQGVDIFVITSSAGAAVPTVLIGLLPDVTLESARRLTQGQYLTVVDTFSLGDRRKQEQQVDAVIAAKPQIIIAAGGTDNGATDALLALVETVALGCHLSAANHRPRLLFVGNPALNESLSKNLGNILTYIPAPNLVPEIGIENLAPARLELTKAYEEIRLETMGGFNSLASLTGNRIIPTLQAEGQFLRFLSRVAEWPRGVLVANLGSAHTTFSLGVEGEILLDVQAQGIGVNVSKLLQENFLEIARWLPFKTTEEEIHEFVLNRVAAPHTVPLDAADLHWELALARLCLQTALRKSRTTWPTHLPTAREDLLPWFSLVIGGGAVLNGCPRPALAAMVLLDAVQPVGLTRLWLDPYHLVAALGAIAPLSALAVAQMHDSSAFLDLGTAVGVLGQGRFNEVAGEVSLVPEGGSEKVVKVKYGSIEVLSLPIGQVGKLTLKPRAAFNFGFGPGRHKTIPVKGGAAGVVIDARGRPLGRPKNDDKRIEHLQKWLKAVGLPFVSKV